MDFPVLKRKGVTISRQEGWQEKLAKQLARKAIKKIEITVLGNWVRKQIDQAITQFILFGTRSSHPCDYHWMIERLVALGAEYGRLEDQLRD